MAGELRTKETGLLRTKTFSVVPEIKHDGDGDEGVVIARFATLDVIDHDGDIIRPKSVGKQLVYAGLWNHADGLPIGDAETYEDGDGAYAKLTHDLEDPDGLRQYRFLKRRAGKKLPVEWSWVFFVKKGNELPEKDPLYEPSVGFLGGPPYEIKKTDIVSVDPVGRGAGVGTAMVEAKHCGPECMAARSADPEPELSSPTDSGIDYERLAEVVAKAVVQALQLPSITLLACGCKEQGELEAKGQGLGDLLRELRDQRELSNDQLADAAGISIATIGQILGGTHVPSASTLQSFANALDVPLSQLATVVEEDSELERSEEEVSDDDDGDDKANAADTESKSDTASDLDIGQQIDAFFAGFPGLPPGVDPGAAAWSRYEQAVLKE